MSSTRPLACAMIAVLAVQPAVVAACTAPEPPRFDGGPGGGVSISVGRIADRVWEPRVIDGMPVEAGEGLSLFISFDGKVEGMGGCNRFSGTADMDAGVLEFSPFTVTEMACLDPARMEREAAFLKALATVRWFVVAPEGFWLQRADRSVAVCLH